MNSEIYQTLDQLEDAFRAQGIDPKPYATVLGQVRDHLDRYARLETAVLGQASIPVPRYLFEGDTLPEDSDNAEGTLAHLERERLEMSGNDPGSLMNRLDREEIKVVRSNFPESGQVEGMFLFDPDVGPVLVVDRRLGSSACDLAFARLYGHFLMDNDPYVIRLAKKEEAEDDPLDARARRFASAFLIDRDELDEFLRAIRWSPGTPLSSEAALQLTVYFGVTPGTLVSRLTALEYIEAGEFPDLAGSPVLRDEPWEQPDLSERFIRLALEAHARDALNMDELAEYLESDVASAERLVHRFRLDS